MFLDLARGKAHLETLEYVMTGETTIDYETLAQDAMRGVVRTVLQRTVKSGLPGDHHFYISFDTCAPGVTLSKRLREKYPSEMTIVLQHRFWDLAVNDDRFEVKLTFDGIPERLVVPFTAIKVFFDPSVRYGLQFEEPDAGPDSAAVTGSYEAGARTASRPARKPRAAKKPRGERDVEPAATVNDGIEPAREKAKPANLPPLTTAAGTGAGVAGEPRREDAGNSTSAQIVSLSDFRKK